MSRCSFFFTRLSNSSLNFLFHSLDFARGGLPACFNFSKKLFRGEYEKLFNALEKSHRNEKRLNTKCQELGSEIASKQAQVDAAQDRTLEDQETISSLKKEIEKARRESNNRTCQEV